MFGLKNMEDIFPLFEKSEIEEEDDRELILNLSFFFFFFINSKPLIALLNNTGLMHYSDTI